MDCEPCCVRLRRDDQLVVDFYLGRQHLSHAARDLFASSAAELLAAGHPPELAPLGRDRLAALPFRYEAHAVSRATHKLACSLRCVALCGDGLRGGELTLGQPPRGEGEYVLLLSDGHLLVHQDAGEAHCDVHLASPQLHCERVSRTIDLSRFVRPGELCMIRSRAPLTVKFGPHSQCALWTRGTCRLELSAAQRLVFWSESDARYHPLSWVADSTQMATRRSLLAFLQQQQQQDVTSAGDRALVYRRLFDQADARCDVSLQLADSLCLLAHYDAVAEPPAWQWDPLGLRGMPWLRQHGTMDSDYAAERSLLESIYVLYCGDAQWPEFYVRRGRRKRLLSVQRMRYQGQGEWFYVNALYFSDRREKVVAYFYLNLQENRLLLIPPH